MEISRADISSTELVDYKHKSFLRLQIDKYLELLPNEIELNAPQTALINAVNNPSYRFIVAALARRTGKSYISNVIGHLVTLIPGSSVLVIAPNYSLSQISWDLQRNFLKLFAIEVTKANAKDKILELSNGSSVRMGSITQVDSVVGRSYDLIIFDEAALNNAGEEAFNTQLRPTLDKKNSKCIFISTPRGRNWFYSFWKRGFSDEFPAWASLRSTWKDNPRIDKNDIIEARKSISKATFEQEYECSFNVLEGTVYNFNRECITEISEYPKYDIIAGLDVGFRDATALCIIATDGKQFYLIDEYMDSGKTTATHAAKIKELIDKYDVDFVYIDSAAQQTKYDLAMEYDICTINANKSILDGIGYVASVIDHNNLLVDSKCTHSIDSLENFRWDTRVVTEKTYHDEYSHMADAIRYALYSHRFNTLE